MLGIEKKKKTILAELINFLLICITKKSPRLPTKTSFFSKAIPLP